jgi:hypothetical protein
MCGFCNVWVCVCVVFVMCGCVYVMGFVVRECVGFVVRECVSLVMCGGVYVWVLCVCMCGFSNVCVYVWV